MRAADDEEKCDRIWERRAAEVLAEAERDAARTAVDGNEDMLSSTGEGEEEEAEEEVEMLVGFEEASLTTRGRRGGGSRGYYNVLGILCIDWSEAARGHMRMNWSRGLFGYKRGTTRNLKGRRMIDLLYSCVRRGMFFLEIPSDAKRTIVLYYINAFRHSPYIVRPSGRVGAVRENSRLSKCSTESEENRPSSSAPALKVGEDTA